MLRMFNPLLRTHPILSLSTIIFMDYGLNFVFFYGDRWPPLIFSPSTNPPALICHPFRFKCPFRRHAPCQPPLCTMASSRSFICPFALFDSHNYIEPQAVYLEEVLLIDRSGFDEGSAQVIPWEALPLLRSFVKERLTLVAFLNCLCPSRNAPGSS